MRENGRELMTMEHGKLLKLRWLWLLILVVTPLFVMPELFQELKVVNFEAEAETVADVTDETADVVEETIGATEETVEPAEQIEPEQTKEIQERNEEVKATESEIEPFELLDDINLSELPTKAKRKKSKTKPVAPASDENTLFGW